MNLSLQVAWDELLRRTSLCAEGGYGSLFLAFWNFSKVAVKVLKVVPSHRENYQAAKKALIGKLQQVPFSAAPPRSSHQHSACEKSGRSCSTCFACQLTAFHCDPLALEVISIDPYFSPF